MTTDDPVTYTHPDVFAAAAAGEPWADPEADPGRIDWTMRLIAPATRYALVDGRPVNPYASTGIRYGRNRFGHWGEQRCSSALVIAYHGGRRHVLLVERADGYGWGVPGGGLGPGEGPVDTAMRTLAEQTGLRLFDRPWLGMRVRYMPDPRGSDESWMVTSPCIADLGEVARLPDVTAGGGARRAAWTPADDYRTLVDHLAGAPGGTVYPGHRDILSRLLDARLPTRPQPGG